MRLTANDSAFHPVLKVRGFTESVAQFNIFVGYGWKRLEEGNSKDTD